MCWLDRCSVLCLLKWTVTLQLIFEPLHKTKFIFFLTVELYVPVLQKVPTYHMLRTRLEWLLWLSRYPGACLSLHLPSTERVSLLSSSTSHPDLSSLVPILPLEWWWKFEITSWGCWEIRNILISSSSLAKIYLLGSSRQPSCTVQTDYALGILQHSRLQFDPLIAIWLIILPSLSELLQGRISHRNPSRTGPKWWAFPFSLVLPTTIFRPHLSNWILISSTWFSSETWAVIAHIYCIILYYISTFIM